MSNLLMSIENNPKATKAYKHLFYQKLIRPGAIITQEYIEQALEVKYEPNSWEFLGAFLLLKSRIETEGFFITQKNMKPPAFKILEIEKMTEFAHKKLIKNMTSNFKVGYIMAAADVSALSENQKLRHKAVQQQSAQAALIQQKVLLDSSFF